MSARPAGSAGSAGAAGSAGSAGSAGTPEPATLAQLVHAARRLTRRPGRTMLGITGAPGAGKSTLAQAIAVALGPELVALAPMDGFHLDDELLVARGVRARKGAVDTFDDAGYAALLARLRACRPDEVVYAPRFDRGLEQAVGSALPVPATVPLVLTEGNYLLLDQGHWPRARAVLDEVWFLDVEPDLRRRRLAERHRSHGEDPLRARERAQGPDEANALVVDASRHLATRVLTLVP